MSKSHSRIASHSDSHKATSIWSIVESMQRKLEGQGMDSRTVDALVTSGLVALLGKRAQRGLAFADA